MKTLSKQQWKERHRGWSNSYDVVAEYQGSTKLSPFTEKGILIETFIRSEFQTTKILKKYKQWTNWVIRVVKR